MKYRVITVHGDEQKVVIETDDAWLACEIADRIDRYPLCQDVYIDMEDDS